MNPARLNAIANHPEVRPWLGGSGPLDLSALIANPANLAAETESGGFVAVNHGGGRYEIHSLFLPEGRHNTVRAMRDGMDYLFTATEAIELVTKVPVLNPAAAALARLAGFAPVFVSEIPWTDGRAEPTTFLTLTVDQWVVRSQAALAAGQALHVLFETAHPAAAHSPEDATHLRFSGAASLMVQRGQALKALMVYNRYATFTGYPPFTLLREHPLVLDLGELIVEVHGESFQVLSCR